MADPDEDPDADVSFDSDSTGGAFVPSNPSETDLDQPETAANFEDVNLAWAFAAWTFYAMRNFAEAAAAQ